MATVRLDRAALNELLTGPQGPVAADLNRRAQLVENEAKRLCPVDRGRLRSSITHSVTSESGRLVAVVGTPVKYALFVHEGTGIYGPRAAPIRPRNGKVLAWPVRKMGARSRQQVGSSTAFATQVMGSPGRPFLRSALVAATR